MQIHKTVFISYRRTNIPIAQAIRLSLMRHGFDVFLDFESINSGSFGHVILNQIAARAHFVLLLTPSALENCVDPNDWVRKEIEEAIKKERNIVPLFFDKFNFEDEKHHLKGNLLPTLRSYNGMKVHWDMFDQSVEKLCTRFLNIPNELVIHPVPASENEIVEEAQEEANEKVPPTPEQLKAQEYFEKGIVSHRNWRLKNAIDDFKSATLLDKDFVDAYFKLGHVSWSIGDEDEALSNYEKAIEINPNHYKADLMRVYILCMKEEYGKALIEANKGVLSNPELDESFSARAWVFSYLKQFDQALIDIDKTILLNPLNGLAYNNRGNILRELKRFDESMQDFNKAISLIPYSEVIFNNRGVTFASMKEYENAIEDYNKAIELNSEYAIAYYNRANAYLVLRNYQQAIINYEHALQIEPDYEGAKMNLEIAKLGFPKKRK